MISLLRVSGAKRLPAAIFMTTEWVCTCFSSKARQIFIFFVCGCGRARGRGLVLVVVVAVVWLGRGGRGLRICQVSLQFRYVCPYSAYMLSLSLCHAVSFCQANPKPFPSTSCFVPLRLTLKNNR